MSPLRLIPHFLQMRQIWASKFTHGAEHSGQSSRSQLKSSIHPSWEAECMAANSKFVFCSKKHNRLTDKDALWPSYRVDPDACRWQVDFRVTGEIVVFRRNFGIFWRRSVPRQSCQIFIPGGPRIPSNSFVYLQLIYIINQCVVLTHRVLLLYLTAFCSLLQIMLLYKLNTPLLLFQKEVL